MSSVPTTVPTVGYFILEESKKEGGRKGKEEGGKNGRQDKPGRKGLWLVIATRSTPFKGNELTR